MRFALAFSLAVPLLATTLPRQQERGDASLAGNSKVATVLDRQGIAVVRPLGHDRWSVLRPRHGLFPGDHVRTEPRGANAVELELAAGGRLVLGPGSLLELLEPNLVRLHRGEVEVAPGAAPLRVRAPRGQERQVKAKTVLQSDGERCVVLDAPPRWLSGYRASTTDEWMGSLIAQVDGRATPLAVGFHKVTVDVRDQIARTTVEQSFVNATGSTLEGQFSFPLPADASISGFAMWIGDEMVEADIVEKQRARAIYEDILRRRADPGLLEWDGGNMFRARVFPIFAHSEKRVRLTYTQVLPLEGDRLVWRYALRSELLRTRPLRELQVKALVSSSVPLRGITSPSHDVRTRHTTWSASAEFDASEYVPERDFELAIQVDRSQPAALVPHRRGDDGYFMLLLSPPEAAGAGAAAKRGLVPEGAPLDLIVVADTSASMDRAARAKQAEFTAALLAMLGSGDRFRLVACDVQPRWWQAEPRAADEANVRAALAFLAERPSLGWTDLDAAFADVLTRTDQKGSVVCYVGDGIGTTGDADPAALAQRLRRLGETASGRRATCHAVSTASTYEQGVLEAIAAIGGGSVRRADDPSAAAERLLAEAAAPPLKDLQVRFEGLRTARVYPERLPNLAAGAQHVVLGRFQPSAGEQRGRAVVTGTRAGEPVRWTAELTLPAGEEGNSFLPRLWARRHVENLLERGARESVAAAKATRDEIVACSEEFGVMTPYTSFLVLENDADRERYGVTRRVRMRDGEQFFADGRERATIELLQQQMLAARTWRLELRQRMRREIETLGRHLHETALARGGDGFQENRRAGAFAVKDRRDLQLAAAPASGRAKSDAGPVADPAGEWVVPGTEASSEFDDLASATPDGEVGEHLADEDFAANEAEELVEAGGKELAGARRLVARERVARDEIHAMSRQQALAGGGLHPLLQLAMTPHGAGIRHPGAAANLAMLGFPQLPTAAAAPAPAAIGPDAPAAKWPEAARTALARLDRRDFLRMLAAGGRALRFTATQDTLHALNGSVQHHGRAVAAFGPGGWTLQGTARHQQPMLEAVLAGRRAVVALGLGLGRTREAAASDEFGFELPVSWLGTRDPAAMLAGYEATLENSETANCVTVVLKQPGEASDHELRVVIDVARGVVLESTTRRAGRTVSTLRCSEHVQVAGAWWPRRTESFDELGRCVTRTTLQVAEVTAAQHEAELRRAEGVLRASVIVDAADPSLAAAKADGDVGREHSLAEHLLLVAHWMASQQWDRAFTALAAAEKIAAREGGDLTWVRAALLQRGRGGQELKELLAARAANIARAATAMESAWLAQYAVQMAQGVHTPAEMLELLQRLEPAFAAPGDDAEYRLCTWLGLRAGFARASGRDDEALALRRRVAELQPLAMDAIVQLADQLASMGRRDDAAALLQRALGETKWLDAEVSWPYHRLTDWLWESRAMGKLLAVLESWCAREPADPTPYLRRLSVWTLLGADAKADAWAHARLDGAGKAPAAAPQAHVAQLGAAIQHALGHGWNYQAQRLGEAWLAPLERTALTLFQSEHDGRGWLALQILNDGRFAATDGAERLRRRLLADLVGAGPASIGQASPSRLQQLVQVLRWDRDSIDGDEWRRVVDLLHARHAAATKADERLALGRLLLQLLDAHGETADALQFLRQMVAATPDRDERRPLAAQLLQRLASASWTEALETEMQALAAELLPVPAAGDEEAEAAHGFAAGAAARWLTDALLRQRVAALMGPAKEHERLPRQELRRRQAAALTRARGELAASLAAATGTAPALLRPWLSLEALCLRAELHAHPTTDLAALEGEARELAAAAKNPLLRERSAFVLAYLATRRRADAALADRTVAWLRERCEPAGDGEVAAERIDWQWHLFRLLTALDRVADLKATLGAFVAAASADAERTLQANRWRAALAWVHAELGELREAAAQFEALAAADELTPREWEALAGWRLALGDPAGRDAALQRRLEVMPEHALAQLVNQRLAALESNRGDGGANAVPADFDVEALRMLRVLLRKASHPAQWHWQVDRLYRATKDFRVLECLAHGVVGHSAEAGYAFLQHAIGLVQQVHEEATCDRLAARARELHAASAPERATDRRALRLLEALAQRRAAEVRNAPGAHAATGLAALREACSGDFGENERRLFAGFLAALGAIPDAAWAAEQLAQLERILRAEEPGTDERLQVALALHRTEWAYGRHDLAIAGLGAALEERRAGAASLPWQCHDAAAMLVGWLEAKQRFADAEQLLQREVDGAAALAPAHREQLEELLLRVRIDCLAARGTVALGSGTELYRALREQLHAALFAARTERLDELTREYCRLYTAASGSGAVTRDVAARDLQTFAHDKLGEVVNVATGSAQSIVSQVAETLRQLGQPRAALAFLLHRLETEPRWFERTGQGGWAAFGWQVAQLRAAAEPLGELEPRLLGVVLRALQRDLESLQAHHRALYGHVHDGNFWREKADQFLAVARRVIAERAASGAHQLHAAEYLWHGLQVQDEAIAVLLRAEKRGVLPEQGRFQLVGWLRERQRFAEALAVLDRLLAERPENLDYRLTKVHTLHALGRSADALQHLEATARLEASPERWHEATIAALANTAVQCGLDRLAVQWFEEVIPLRQRSRPDRGVGDGVLSSYHQQLAQALVRLGEDDRAVDAAAAGVVAWGREHHQQLQALQSLQNILRQVRDLDGFTARWTSRVRELGADAPILRKALALVRLEQGNAAAALPHLYAARDLQPLDREVHDALVRAHDVLQQPREACAALLAATAEFPLDLERWADLGRRLYELGDAEGAERAWTSLAEMRPHDAEGHRSLAQQREQQHRFADAAEQWRQVVRVRTDEPDGWLGLARAQIRAGQHDAARATLQQVLETKWPERFANVEHEARSLLRPLSQPPR